MQGSGNARTILGIFLIMASLGLTACKDKKNNGGSTGGTGVVEDCPVGKLCLSPEGEAQGEEGQEDAEGTTTGEGADSDQNDIGQTERRSQRPVPRPGDLKGPRRISKPSSKIKVIYFDELSSSARQRLQVVKRSLDSSRAGRKVLAFKAQGAGETITWVSQTDAHGHRFSKKLISEVYNSHGCFSAAEGFCLVIENNNVAAMGVVMGTNSKGKKVTQIQSLRFKQQTREKDVFMERLRGQRVIVSPFSHRTTNQRLTNNGATFNRSPSPQGLRVTGICGIEGRLNMSDQGALLVGNLKGTTQATPQFPEQYARVSCLSFGKPIRPIRVVINLEGGWLGLKLQFSAWFRGKDISYDQWDFGATGLGVIPGPIGLLTPPGTSYGLIDLSADLLLGSVAPIGTGVFARKNHIGPNTFVIPFYIKGENGMGDIGAQLEAYSLQLRAHPDEF